MPEMRPPTSPLSSSPHRQSKCNIVCHACKWVAIPIIWSGMASRDEKGADSNKGTHSFYSRFQSLEKNLKTAPNRLRRFRASERFVAGIFLRRKCRQAMLFGVFLTTCEEASIVNTPRLYIPPPLMPALLPVTSELVSMSVPEVLL